MNANKMLRFHARIFNNLMIKRQISDAKLKTTILNDFHLQYEGKMVPFAGWSMPVQYKDMGIIDSHKHTRSQASLFDVSHMLQTKIYGKDKEDFIESLVVSNIKELLPNKGTLSMFTNTNGGIMDDVIINQTDQEFLYVVSNAGCSEKISAHFKTSVDVFKSEGKDVNIEFVNNGLIALQGPDAMKALQEGTNIDLNKLFFMDGVNCVIHKIENCRVTRCGYTGEDGFEISVPKEHTVNLAEKLLNHSSVKLAGLGARDSLRMEAGLCLYGNDIDETTTPVQAALTWCIGKRRRRLSNFPGAEVILNEIKQKPLKRRVGIISDGITARGGAEVQDVDGKSVGKVTSGCPSPTLKQNIAMAYIPNTMAKVGTKLKVVVRKKTYDCTVTKMPFVPSQYYVKS